ncbi:hypothetical protein BDD12DRAFT_420942 [Trichophaea hybrida]|nr:hypothetical protein BDD12DRAFT_420942 [Trichophaea hybrida]
MVPTLLYLVHSKVVIIPNERLTPEDPQLQMNPCRAYPSTSTSTSNSRLSRFHQSSPTATWSATYLQVLFITLLSSFFSLGPSRSRQPRRLHSNAVHRHTTIHFNRRYCLPPLLLPPSSCLLVPRDWGGCDGRLAHFGSGQLYDLEISPRIRFVCSSVTFLPFGRLLIRMQDSVIPRIPFNATRRSTS